MPGRQRKFQNGSISKESNDNKNEIVLDEESNNDNESQKNSKSFDMRQSDAVEYNTEMDPKKSDDGRVLTAK